MNVLKKKKKPPGGSCVPSGGREHALSLAPLLGLRVEFLIPHFLNCSNLLQINKYFLQK